MRSKLLIMAGSMTLLVVALIFGVNMCTQAGAKQQQATEQAGAEAAEQAEQAGAGDDGAADIPNPTKGGVRNVNKNLQKMKQGMQKTMDRRPGRLDKAIEGSNAGQ